MFKKYIPAKLFNVKHLIITKHVGEICLTWLDYDKLEYRYISISITMMTFCKYFNDIMREIGRYKSQALHQIHRSL